jgi:hypothetical protein
MYKQHCLNLNIAMEWGFYSVTLFLHPRFILYIISTIGTVLVIRLLFALKIENFVIRI